MVTADELYTLSKAVESMANAARLIESTADKTVHTIKYFHAVCRKWDEYLAQEQEVQKAKSPESKVEEIARPRKPSQAMINDHFDELWKLYPSKRGKTSVSITKRTKLYDVPIESMRKAVQRYTDELKRKGKEDYILNGSTWFNGRYEDYMDGNFNDIDGDISGKAENKPKGRFDALTPEELAYLKNKGIISADESINYSEMDQSDYNLLSARGII